MSRQDEEKKSTQSPSAKLGSGRDLRESDGGGRGGGGGGGEASGGRETWSERRFRTGSREGK